MKFVKPALLVCAAATAPALADWTEVGDAGELTALAQMPVGDGALLTIHGTLIDLGGQTDDVDMYRIRINDTALFAISMEGTNLSIDNDAMLWVFDLAGNLLASDDDGGNGLLPAVQAGALEAFPAGEYLVAVSLFNTRPTDNPITGWLRNPGPYQTGSYQLNLRHAAYAPTPGALALLGLGGLVAARRRRA